MVATELKNRGMSLNVTSPAEEGSEHSDELNLKETLLALPHDFRFEFSTTDTNKTFTASLRAGDIPTISTRGCFSNVVEAPGKEVVHKYGKLALDSDYGFHFDSLTTKKARGFGTTVASIAATIAMLEPVKAGLMTDANYNNPVTRQEHREMGLKYKGSVVHLLVDGTHQGSGVLIGDGTCLICTSHQFKEAGVAANPINKRVQISTGINYVSAVGEIIDIVDFVVHPQAPAAGQLGVDLVIAKLSSKPIDAKPMAISDAPAVIGDLVDLAGFGTPATNSTGVLPVTGELLGGQAPISSLPPSGGGIITTRFSLLGGSTIPLIFGGTPQISGGALVNQTTQTLSGTVFGGSSPSGVQYTYSIDLFKHKVWISEKVESFSITSPTPAPTLACELVQNQQIKLICSGSPLLQSGGKWVAEKSSDLVGWQELPEASQNLLYQNNFLLVPADEQKAFYRLSWKGTN